MSDPRGHFDIAGVAARSHSDIYSKVIGSLVFTGLTALSAVSFRLWFTPVPVTFQVLIVLLSGMMLGRKWGAISQAQYLALGAMGLPIFHNFTGGPLVLAGPTGGYLFGFVFGAYASGWVFEQLRARTAFAAWIGSAAGIGAIYLFGASWLSVWVRSTSFVGALQLGVIPFIGIDLMKAAIAASIVAGKSKFSA